MAEKGISVKELTERSEISEPRIRRLLGAETEPTARELLRLAGALDVEVSDVLEPSAHGSVD